MDRLIDKGGWRRLHDLTITGGPSDHKCQIMFKDIRWRIAVPYVAMILLVMVALVVYVTRAAREAQIQILQDSLLVEARGLADLAQPVAPDRAGDAGRHAADRDLRPRGGGGRGDAGDDPARPASGTRNTRERTR